MHMYAHTVLTRIFWGECWAWTSARVALLPLGRPQKMDPMAPSPI